jgi:hypothetical protein
MSDHRNQRPEPETYPFTLIKGGSAPSLASHSFDEFLARLVVKIQFGCSGRILGLAASIFILHRLMSLMFGDLGPTVNFFLKISAILLVALVVALHVTTAVAHMISQTGGVLINVARSLVCYGICLLVLKATVEVAVRQPALIPEIPCPCGSGRTFRECHGRGEL